MNEDYEKCYALMKNEYAEMLTSRSYMKSILIYIKNEKQ